VCENSVPYTKALVWQVWTLCTKCQSGITGPFHKSNERRILKLAWHSAYHDNRPMKKMQYQTSKWEFFLALFIVAIVLESLTQHLQHLESLKPSSCPLLYMQVIDKWKVLNSRPAVHLCVSSYTFNIWSFFLLHLYPLLQYLFFVSW
jgi:hypothetical protein